MAKSKPAGLPKDKKATIVIKKKSGDVTLTCHFNPTDYAVSRSVSWTPRKIAGQDQPAFDFGGGAANTMSLKLLFDTSLEAEGPKDVREYTSLLWDSVYIDRDDKNAATNTGQPPHIIFIWGKTWSFEAVVTQMSQDFVLFNEDGVPMRSNVTLSLTQVKDDRSFGKQNPTSGGVPGQVHIVREGDRLDLLAAQYFEKPTMWRKLAEHNNINNPRHLTPGQRLIIPTNLENL